MNSSPPANPTCDERPGRVYPVVDPRRCENKGPCVEVCPYDVLEIRPLAPADRAALPFHIRMKVWIHAGKQAFVARPESCHGCGLCVTACPEKAIQLRLVPKPFCPLPT